jgi:hypothetical protein
VRKGFFIRKQVDTGAGLLPVAIDDLVLFDATATASCYARVNAADALVPRFMPSRHSPRGGGCTPVHVERSAAIRSSTASDADPARYFFGWTIRGSGWPDWTR